MPRLHGYRWIGFVATDWQPADNETLIDVDEWAKSNNWFGGIQVAELIDKLAERQRLFADHYEMKSAQCARFGHLGRTHDERGYGVIEACGIDDAIDVDTRQPLCVIRMRNAANRTRSPERPRFVVVEVKV